MSGQNEREETTQNTIVTKSAACASYKSNYVTYIPATYTRAKRQKYPSINMKKCCISVTVSYRVVSEKLISGT